MGKTSIEWCDYVWNPITGCSKVSQGCAHCYAERMAKRMWGKRPFTQVRCHFDRLEWPLKWKQGRVFVDSMGDLFHEQVPVEFIHEVFSVMMRADWLTFMVLPSGLGECTRC